MTAKGIVFRLFLSFAFALGAVATYAPIAHASICLWTGETNNDWTDPLNWSGCNNLAPGEADIVVINPIITFTPVLNSNTTIFQLDLNPGGVLATAGGVTLTTSILNLNGGITGQGAISVTNLWNWSTLYGPNPSDGLLNGGGQITIKSGALGKFSSYGPRLSDFTLNNYGVVEPFSDLIMIVVSNHSAINNYGTFDLAGSIQDDDDNSTFTNHSVGTILATGAAFIDTSLNNNGLVDIHGSEFNICRGGVSSGQFTSLSGKLLAFGNCLSTFPPATFTFTPASSITASLVEFTGMPTTIHEFHGTFDPLGTTSWTQINTPTTFYSDAVVLSFGNSLEIYSTFVLDTVAPTNMMDLTVSNSFGVFDYFGTIEVYHEMKCQNGGQLTGGGLLRVMPGGILRFTGGTDQTGCTLDGKSVENRGTGNWSSPTNIVGENNSTLVNTASATFISWGGRNMTGSMIFQNDGTLVKDTAGTTTTIEVNFVNNGGIKVNAGNLVFTNEVTFPTGTTNEVTGNIQVGTLINDGTLTVTGTVTGNLTNNGFLFLNGTVTGDLVNNRSLDPGTSPGLAIVLGNFTQAAEGGMGIDLSKDAPGPSVMPLIAPFPGVDFDQLQVSGTAQLGGHLQLLAGGSFNRMNNLLELPFLTADGGIVNTFDTYGTSDFDDYWNWTIIYRPNEVVFRFGSNIFIPMLKK